MSRPRPTAALARRDRRRASACTRRPPSSSARDRGAIRAARASSSPGAGSGKTETMANRVVWLLANGHVGVPEVLGLTFTRKAAGELAERMRERVGQLVAEGIAEVDARSARAAAVGTYNSFASSIYRENAMLIGRERDAAVLGEASAWHARAVGRRAHRPTRGSSSSTPRSTGSPGRCSRSAARSPRTSPTAATCRRSRATSSRWRGCRSRRRASAPTSSRSRRRSASSARCRRCSTSPTPTPPRSASAATSSTPTRSRSPSRSASGIPRSSPAHRERYRIVLLDEYQDTSVVQTRLLATLFRGHPVMAVGDPNQSIYGWRGASAANLARFVDDFADAGAAQASTTCRRAGATGVVLDAANRIIEPLDAGIPKAPLGALARSPAPDASRSPGPRRSRRRPTSSPRWFAARLGVRRATPDRERRAALPHLRERRRLHRRRCAQHGVPVHVLGVGGLLDQPVIADLVCALRVLHDPTAGSELVRVLGGARWRIGPADLAALNGLAPWLADRDLAQPAPRRRRARRACAPRSPPTSRRRSSTPSTSCSPRPTAHSRARATSARSASAACGAPARSCSRCAAAPDSASSTSCTSCSRSCCSTSRSPPTRRSRSARRASRRSTSCSPAFADVAEHPTLGAFLGWLTEAEQRDRLAPRQDEPEPGAVQVLSIHGSKGLEWDVVAVPRLVDDELPSKPRTVEGLARVRRAAQRLQGRPRRAARAAVAGRRRARREFDEAVRAFADENRERHADEERRLAYVAVTRTRRDLLLSGSWWATQKAPRKPSPFLRELALAGIVDPHGAARPRPSTPRTRARARRARAALAARSARRPARARCTRPPTPCAPPRERPSGAGIGPRLADELRLLLEERRRRLEGPGAAADPGPRPGVAVQGLRRRPRGGRRAAAAPDAAAALPGDPPRHALPRLGRASLDGRGRRPGDRRRVAVEMPTRSTSTAPGESIDGRHGRAPARTAGHVRGIRVGRPQARSRSSSSSTCRSTSTCSSARSTPSTTCRPAASSRPRHPLPGRRLEDRQGAARRARPRTQADPARALPARLREVGRASTPRRSTRCSTSSRTTGSSGPSGSTTRRRCAVRGPSVASVRVRVGDEPPPSAEPHRSAARRRVAPVAEVERDRRGRVHRQRCALAGLAALELREVVAVGEQRRAALARRGGRAGVSSSRRSTSPTVRIGPVSGESGSLERSCTLAASPSSIETASSTIAASRCSTPCSSHRAELELAVEQGALREVGVGAAAASGE